MRRSFHSGKMVPYAYGVFAGAGFTTLCADWFKIQGSAFKVGAEPNFRFRAIPFTIYVRDARSLDVSDGLVNGWCGANFPCAEEAPRRGVRVEGRECSPLRAVVRTFADVLDYPTPRRARDELYRIRNIYGNRSWGRISALCTESSKSARREASAADCALPSGVEALRKSWSSAICVCAESFAPVKLHVP